MMDALAEGKCGAQYVDMVVCGWRVKRCRYCVFFFFKQKTAYEITR